VEYILPFNGRKKCIKNADTMPRKMPDRPKKGEGKAKSGEEMALRAFLCVLVQISSCQFMIMAPHEAGQNVNYTPAWQRNENSSE